MKRLQKYFPAILTLLCAAWLVPTLFISQKPEGSASGFDIDGFGHLPVLVNGRVKPLDTVARTTLLRLQGRQSVHTPDGRAIAPAQWLLDMCFNPDAAQQYHVFEITHPEVLALAQLTPADGDGGKRFSYEQLESRLADIERQGRLADAAESEQRNAFQRAVLTLYGNLNEYQKIQYSFIPPGSTDFLGELGSMGKTLNAQLAAALKTRFQMMSDLGSMLVVPPEAIANAFPAQTTNWRKTGDAMLGALDSGRIPPAVMVYAGIAHTWRTHQSVQFNEIVRLYRDQISRLLPGEIGKINVEWRLNLAQPFYSGMLLFVIVFLLGVFSWLKWPDTLGRSAFWLMCLAWLLMTSGIITRMVLEGRPPVTNLYSSALGVGWCAVTLCIMLEAINKNAIASVAGGLTGFGTLIVAHHLSLAGSDTMEMMRAVLDSNFWLATHVVAITLGYGATFLAGMLALIYICRSRLTRSLDRETTASLERMIYGIVCFATLFSFVGTILGGIWADQSWGRFWGWDPKENGALIIVIWNAVVLHARWGKLVGVRGLATMAVFGNIVTAWSWFGTNLLSVGLHSYGFTDSGAVALSVFLASQVVVIALTRLPQRSPA